MMCKTKGESERDDGVNHEKKMAKLMKARMVKLRHGVEVLMLTGMKRMGG
jgi:hypothetical protein